MQPENAQCVVGGRDRWYIFRLGRLPINKPNLLSLCHGCVKSTVSLDIFSICKQKRSCKINIAGYALLAIPEFQWWPQQDFTPAWSLVHLLPRSQSSKFSSPSLRTWSDTSESSVQRDCLSATKKKKMTTDNRELWYERKSHYGRFKIPHLKASSYFLLKCTFSYCFLLG